MHLIQLEVAFSMKTKDMLSRFKFIKVSAATKKRLVLEFVLIN